MELPFYPQIIIPNPSGLSDVSCSGSDYHMETNETSFGHDGGSMAIRKKTELTIREELQRETDNWLVGVV